MQVERRRLVPVALAVRVREAAVHRARRRRMPTRSCPCAAREHRVDDRFGGRQRRRRASARVDATVGRRSADADRRRVPAARRAVRRPRRRPRSRSAPGSPDSDSACDAWRAPRISRIVEIALGDAARLAHLAAVHPHEVGCLPPRTTRCTVSPATSAPIERRGELVEVVLHRQLAHAFSSAEHVDAGEHARRRRVADADRSATARPCRSTACRARCTVSALPTRARLRQKFALMPR